MEADRREELRLKTVSGNEVPVRDVRVSADELRALLDSDAARERVGELPEKWRERAEQNDRLAEDSEKKGWNDRHDAYRCSAATKRSFADELRALLDSDAARERVCDREALVRVLNQARCLEDRTVGNEELADRIIALGRDAEREG